MKYKAIISDFDGTLLRNDGIVSQESARAIKDYIVAGGFFTIATGRMYASIRQQLTACGLNDVDVPIINCQGASVHSSMSDKMIMQARMSTKAACEFLEYTYKIGLYTQVYIDDVLYVDKSNELTDVYTDAAKVYPREVGNLIDYVSRTGAKPHKMVTIDEESKNAKHIADFMREFNNNGLDFAASHSLLIEIFDKTAGKGNMVKKIVESRGIDLKETVCIGDNQNDISMITMAGLGVAVANAREDVKAVANYITTSNDEDGVSNIIRLVLAGKL